MSSIAAQVIAATLGAFALSISLMLALLEGPFTLWVYPRTVAENAEMIEGFVQLIEQASEDDERLLLNAFQSRDRAALITPGFVEALGDRSDLRSRFLGQGFGLAERDIRFASRGPAQLGTLDYNDATALFTAGYALQIGVELNDGRVLNIWIAPSMSLDRRPAVIGFLILVSVLVALSLSAAIVFIVNRPIRRLELEAHTVELADAGGSVSEQGPVELRQLAAALNQMRRRLAGLISEREQIIAAIAHDVRTGLTRVRLRLGESGLAKAPGLDDDLNQMEHLVSDMVAYARAESPSGHRELVKMNQFLEDVAAHAPTPVRYESGLRAGETFVIAADPIALRRLFENLLENARRYGGGTVTMRVAVERADLVIRIEDEGPGVPDDQIEAVFKPFQRLESSRNRATGGSGLGLGIARSIANAHGASLALENLRPRGLAAVVTFPGETRT
ncbi:ATP-binding protein [Maricaulaceae bacterium MS644]